MGEMPGLDQLVSFQDFALLPPCQNQDLPNTLNTLRDQLPDLTQLTTQPSHGMIMAMAAGNEGASQIHFLSVPSVSQ